MKKVARLFSIGFMTLLLSFNVAQLFAQSKGNTLKEVYVGNTERPQQIAAYGTPAWLFKTMYIGFTGDKTGAMTFSKCIYSINTYTGGLDQALVSDNIESTSFSYRVKNGNVYIWDLDVEEPQNESDYSMILKIENDGLTLVKSNVKGFQLGKLISTVGYKEINNMSPSAYQQYEINLYTKLLRNKEANSYIENDRNKEEDITKKSDEELKSIFFTCRYLFKTEEDFVACITQKNITSIENDMKPLLSQKMSEISKTGFDKDETSKLELLRICNICTFSNPFTKNLADYAENELKSFVAERESLTKAYNKAKVKNSNMKCSKFLFLYITKGEV